MATPTLPEARALPGSERLEATALRPLVQTSRRFRVLIVVLALVVGVGAVAYVQQLRRGLEVTGMAETSDKIMWGVYISNFVFFIGISHAGTLISAILRVAHAGWRTPITRMAEFITVAALCIGALLPIIDLGRPDRLLNVFTYGRWQSPILWDFVAISTYLVGSLMYLYIPLIPDLALVRDRLGHRLGRIRRGVYDSLALGWSGQPEQRHSLGRALGLMMIIIIPVAISVHTVVSWIFATTLRTGWNTALFGAYFVLGAIFSGIAALIIVMAVLRRALGLQEWVTERHFVNLGYLLAAFGLIVLYANILELVTEGYKLEGGASFYLGQILSGSFTSLYLLYLFGGLLLPMAVVLFRRTRRLSFVVGAAIAVVVAMWIERYIIVVASLRVAQTPYPDLAEYTPTGVEIGITAGLFALFGLLIAAAVKVMPVVSVWEMRESEAAVAIGEPAVAIGEPASRLEPQVAAG